MVVTDKRHSVRDFGKGVESWVVEFGGGEIGTAISSGDQDFAVVEKSGGVEAAGRGHPVRDFSKGVESEVIEFGHGLAGTVGSSRY